MARGRTISSGDLTSDTTLKRAITYWRQCLSVPQEDRFQTEKQIEKAEAEWARRLQALAAASSKHDSAAIRRAEKSLRALPSISMSIMVPNPLSAVEIETIKAKRMESLKAFDNAVAKSNEILLSLLRNPADPAYILWLLIRYCWLRGTEAPRPHSIHFQKTDFELSHPTKGQDPFAWANKMERGEFIPIRLEAKKGLPLPAPRRRKPGPAEAGPTTAMALLADHLRKTTGTPHWRNIAELCRIWAPWIRGLEYLTADHVRRRVKDLSKTKEFRRLLRFATRYRRTIHYTP